MSAILECKAAVVAAMAAEEDAQSTAVVHDALLDYYVASEREAGRDPYAREERGVSPELLLVERKAGAS